MEALFSLETTYLVSLYSIDKINGQGWAKNLNQPRLDLMTVVLAYGSTLSN